MAIGDIKTFDFVYSGLSLQINAIDMGDGQVRFEVTCLQGYADINALYWSDGVPDGNNFDLGTKKDNSLNMNGSGVDWDGGIKLSDTGLGAKGGATKPTYLHSGESYVLDAKLNWDSLDTLGVRATSTSTSGGSIKGVDTGAEITPAPTVCVEDAAPVVEGNDAVFTITLEHAYEYDVTITYTTVTGTAGGDDFAEQAGSVTIHAGDLSALVKIATVDDTLVEDSENFTLHLTGATADIPDIAGQGDSVIEVHLLCIDGSATILDNDVAAPVNQPPEANDDAAACVTELAAAITGVSGNVLENDSDPDGNAIAVTMVNGTELVDGKASIVLHDAADNAIGTLEINESGDYTFKYTGAYNADHTSPTFTYTISDGHGGTDTATVTLCLDPLENPGRGDAFSPGYWKTHGFDGSERLPSDLKSGVQTLDDFFNLDDGVGPVTNRTWTVGGQTVQDITLAQAVAQTGNTLSTPDLPGNENALIQQAAAAVADWYDNDHQADFVAAYIYQRAIKDNNGTLADNPFDADSVMADLVQQVHDAFEGTAGAYSLEALKGILELSHEA
ncbi:Ig-like domain-containing protein [Aquamicrobium soli]|uniref:Ig-like domain-containing protein n=1 Tax=Aquamicrobium soli TaxID=1811518 RepID=A0ABV7K9X4_9HYPH